MCQRVFASHVADIVIVLRSGEEGWKKMKMIVAIVRTNTLGDIVKALEERGVWGITSCEIKGIGEGVRLYRPYTNHNRIELIVPDYKVDDVTDVIVRHARTGYAGDGIIGVYPMDFMIKIRTGEKEKG